MLITVTDDMAARKGRFNHHQTVGHSISAPNKREFEEGERRIRILRLVRPSNGSYGFHLRGGREHGTGFFISHVEPGTEAYAQGLRTGDQVVRVNTFNVSRALHREVASIVQSGAEVVLEVRSTGLIPVKNNPSDPLSWVLVENKNDSHNQSNSSASESPSDYSQFQPNGYPGANASSGCGNPVQIIVGGAGKYTIGCSICKGPAEKPGIFVQRVREGGMAESAGLRPGDQILSCNGISFFTADFQQAVQAMKSSPCLRLEVQRGAGLELVMGESSGYNSSASSETGEETYPSSENDSRDGFSHSLASTLTRRLNGMRERVQLDSHRDWKEIEAEWADAEVTEKRTILENNHTMLSRRVYSSALPVSTSFMNLTINENDHDRIEFGNNSCHHFPSNQNLHIPTHNKGSSLCKPRSMIDLRPKNDNVNYKIAIQTATDEHVSKIVIPSAPKDEHNALLRLEQLSSGSKASSMLSLKPPSTLPKHVKTYSISSTSSEEFMNHEHFPHHGRPSEPSQRESRHLLRCRSVPQDCNFISSEDSDSLLSYPSSTICITDNGSGRFTSKVHIRSPPPPPPPRGNGTKLTRQHRKLRCTHHNHHRNLPKSIPGVISSHLHLNHHSPPTSPCTSSGSSNDNIDSCAHLSRQKSFGSLSASSDESNNWNDLVERNNVTSSTTSRISVNNFSTANVQCSKNNNNKDFNLAKNERFTSPCVSIPLPPSPPSSSSIPPPPPPPPPLPLSGKPSSMPLGLGSAIHNEIISRQQELNGVAIKLRSVKDRADDGMRERPVVVDPKKMQHEQLMEEFKRAHAMMVAKRQQNKTDDEDS